MWSPCTPIGSRPRARRRTELERITTEPPSEPSPPLAGPLVGVLRGRTSPVATSTVTAPSATLAGVRRGSGSPSGVEAGLLVLVWRARISAPSVLLIDDLDGVVDGEWPVKRIMR